jgi:hypothetical protein
MAFSTGTESNSQISLLPRGMSQSNRNQNSGRGENLAKISLPAGAMLGGENFEEVSTGHGLEFEERRSITVPSRAHLGSNVQSSSTRNQRHAC